MTRRAQQHESEEINFRYRDKLVPNRTHTSERVAVHITTRFETYSYSTMIFHVGHDVLKLLGWEAGYDRVQFAPYGDQIAIGRNCGQFKLSSGSSGSQSSVSISAHYFSKNPPERMGVTPLDWSIKKQRGGEKILLIPSIKEIFAEAVRPVGRPRTKTDPRFERM
jgi:hypothetical protein